MSTPRFPAHCHVLPLVPQNEIPHNMIMMLIHLLERGLYGLRSLSRYIRVKAALMKAWVGGILTDVQHCNGGYNCHEPVLTVYHSAPYDGTFIRRCVEHVTSP